MRYKLFLQTIDKIFLYEYNNIKSRILSIIIVNIPKKIPRVVGLLGFYLLCYVQIEVISRSTNKASTKILSIFTITSPPFRENDGKHTIYIYYNNWNKYTIKTFRQIVR